MAKKQLEKVFLLDGQEINSVTPYHEHITLNIGNEKDGYHNIFISSKMLVTILSEFEFTATLKRTRHWAHLEIDDWRVERFDEPRTY